MLVQTFKDLYNIEFFQCFTKKIKVIYPEFKEDAFVGNIMSDDWSELPFKKRIRRITHSLKKSLPNDIEEAFLIIHDVSNHCSGVEYLFLPDFIEVYGIEHFDLSVKALKDVTCCVSAEFAVRPFIERYPEKMMAELLQWTKSSDKRIRRLSSEGCRPLLPWSFRLNQFVVDPTPIIPILENLINDSSEYVRRSVANNLNDISKHHADIVKAFTRKWLRNSGETDKLLKHACRTLLKYGDEEILVLFGLEQLNQTSVESLEVSSSVLIGEGKTMEFSFVLNNNKHDEIKIRIEYGIGYMKANGKISEKKFKLSEKVYKKGKTKINRSHSFAPITTRRYYPGKHTLTIYLNGISYKSVVFYVREK